MIALLLACAATTADPDGSALSLADLPEYRKALSPQRGPAARVLATTFVELWREPGEYQGRQVVVEGVVARRFRQDAIGEFPALTETWIEDGDKNLVCLAYPTAIAAAGLGDRIRFQGTFLKMLRYRADVDRLAPLVVGPTAPVIVSPGSGAVDAWGSLCTSHAVLVAIGAALVVITVLAVQHARRPVRRSLDRGAPPEFVDGGADVECV